MKDDEALGAADLNRYADSLQQISVRLGTAESLLAGSPSGWQAELALERIALHVRKVLELQPLSTLVTHRSDLVQVRRALGRADPKDAQRMAKQINPRFWPEPGRRILIEGRRFDWVPKQGAFLVESDWGRAYGLASRLLHAANPYAGPINVERTKEQLSEILAKLRHLLSEHRVFLAGADRFVVGTLDAGNGLASVGLFERLSG